MCGIAGIMRFDDRPIAPERIAAMRDQLGRRGPDGKGMTVQGRCGLAHARLAVVDLFGGRQPMHAARTRVHGPLHIVFNGEIYNHHALRRKLAYLGHQFISDHSDTEVLLHGYRQWGLNLPEHLEGMFAFAIFDHDDERLFLARDRAGQKPLYLHCADDELRFASVPAAIVAGSGEDTATAIDHAALLSYLRFGHTFAGSLTEHVEALPAAHWMAVERDGRFVVRRYWARPTPHIREPITTAAAELRHTLEAAVAATMDADVQLGCLLSGGVNSSIVAALAQRALRERNGVALRTYSVIVPGMAYDETDAARAVAEHLGTRHHALEASPAHAIEDLEHLMRVTGEPIADVTLLPTYWMCRAAHEHVRVALAGDGGDELFAGHERYRAMRRLRAHAWWLRFMPDTAAPPIEDESARADWRNLVVPARAGEHPAQQYRALIELFTERQIEALGVRRPDTGTRRGAPPVSDWPRHLVDRVAAALQWDREHALPYGLLRRLDHASMAVPIELRCPMLDTQVQELAGHWHSRVLLHRGRPKALLRALGRELLPEPIVHRSKHSFRAAMAGWFREHLRGDIADRLFAGGLDDLGIDRAAVRALYQEHAQHQADHTGRLFALLQLSIWSQWRRAVRASAAAA